MGLICPYCRDHVRRDERTVVCMQGHSFDVAREGYVNFLRSRHPGDTLDMLTARRRFLDRGHYAPVASRLCEIAAEYLADSGPQARSPAATVLDAGCGEGYYLGSLQSCLDPSGRQGVEFAGIDSSRDACRLASQRYGNMRFVVSDLKDFIPVSDGSVDVLLNVFAPRSVSEFARVLAISGTLIVVIPQPAHLAELRSAFSLIGMEEKKAEQVARRLEPAFTQTDCIPLQYDIHLGHDEVLDLISMSPSHRHMIAPLGAFSVPFQVKVAVDILTFEHNGELRGQNASTRLSS